MENKFETTTPLWDICMQKTHAKGYNILKSKVVVLAKPRISELGVSYKCKNNTWII